MLEKLIDKWNTKNMLKYVLGEIISTQREESRMRISRYSLFKHLNWLYLDILNNNRAWESILLVHGNNRSQKKTTNMFHLGEDYF